MKQLYILFFIYFAFSSLNIYAQRIDYNDSLLIRKYRNKVYPKSVTSLSNILYAGIDNDLVMIYPDNKSKTYNYIVSTNNGSLYKTDDGYLNIPRNAGRAFFSIYLINEDHDTLLIGKKQFVVRNLPLASIKVGDVLISEGAELNKALFLNGDSIKLFFTDDLPESAEWYVVKSFTVGYPYGKQFISAENNGPVIGDDIKNLLNKVTEDRELSIRVNIVAPSGILRFLPITKFKITQQTTDKQKVDSMKR
ncbi:MAG TPA: hypothetical protein VHO72_07815 [Bacteroidales bacterium]|nr:hypothetical protein [Bacteroidales bacterium]